MGFGKHGLLCLFDKKRKRKGSGKQKRAEGGRLFGGVLLWFSLRIVSGNFKYIVDSACGDRRQWAEDRSLLNLFLAMNKKEPGR